jgi:translation initiation factor IF-3
MNPNSNPPVCKVMDYNKYKYERAKKEKEALKKQKSNMSELKEFRLSPVIDVGDFETKLKQVTKYLLKGDRIKLSIRFKGRQMAHTEIGQDVLVRFAGRLSEISDIEQQPKLDGRSMTMLLAPIKDNK